LIAEEKKRAHLLCFLLQIPLSGQNSVVGRAFVVHELGDDLGKGMSLVLDLCSNLYSLVKKQG
jgi:hypothetical protein